MTVFNNLQHQIFEVDVRLVVPGEVRRFELNGFNCYIYRVPFSQYLNGYVEIPRPNEEQRRRLMHARVHGGVTFFGYLDHVNGGDGYLVGFDTGHYQDWNPRHDHLGITYKNVNFVIDELKNLTAQIAKF